MDEGFVVAPSGALCLKAPLRNSHETTILLILHSIFVVAQIIAQSVTSDGKNFGLAVKARCASCGSFTGQATRTALVHFMNPGSASLARRFKYPRLAAVGLGRVCKIILLAERFKYPRLAAVGLQRHLFFELCDGHEDER